MGTAGMKRRVEASAKERGVSVGKLARRALLEYLELQDGVTICPICWESLAETDGGQTEWHTHDGIKANGDLWW